MEKLNKTKASKKAALMLKELDAKELEQVNGGTCLTCGLILTPRPGGLPGFPPRMDIVIGS